MPLWVSRNINEMLFSHKAFTDLTSIHPSALKQNASSNNQDYEGGYSHVIAGFLNDETSPPFSVCTFSHIHILLIIQKYLTWLDICFLPKSGTEEMVVNFNDEFILYFGIFANPILWSLCFSFCSMHE